MVGKTIVVGLVQREGQAVVKIQPNNQAATIVPMIQEHLPAGETVYTDGHGAYHQITSLGFAHEVVVHSAKQYVAGRAHPNNIEGFWSNTKREIDGVHHAVSPKYLQGYLDSYVYRFNHRNHADPLFGQLLGKSAGTF